MASAGGRGGRTLSANRPRMLPNGRYLWQSESHSRSSRRQAGGAAGDGQLDCQCRLPEMHQPMNMPGQTTRCCRWGRRLCYCRLSLWAQACYLHTTSVPCWYSVPLTGPHKFAAHPSRVVDFQTSCVKCAAAFLNPGSEKL